MDLAFKNDKNQNEINLQNQYQNQKSFNAQYANYNQ